LLIDTQKIQQKICMKMRKKIKMQLKVINYFNYCFHYKRNVLAKALKTYVGTPRFRGKQLEYHCSTGNSLSVVNVLWLSGIVFLNLQY
jgi:hypothetical protein